MATNNGDCPCLSHKLISASELSKHLTTSHCSYIDATNGDCPSSSHKLTSASELYVSKHLTTSICPYSDTLIHADPFQSNICTKTT
jgi:hypothetical protein